MGIGQDCFFVALPLPTHSDCRARGSKTTQKDSPPAELRQPGDGMKDWAHYVVDQRRAEESKEREKRAQSADSETAEDRKNCCVCYCQPAACAFVPEAPVQYMSVARRCAPPEPCAV